MSILGLGGQFSIASISSDEDVAVAVGPHGIVGTVCSQGLLSDAPSSMAPQRSPVANVRRSLSSSSSIIRACGVGSLVAPGGEVGCRCSSVGSSSLSFAHRCLYFGVGGPSSRPEGVRDMVTGRVLHISILEMHAVVLELAVFLPQLTGQALSCE